jgi:hypothetical protein
MQIQTQIIMFELSFSVQCGIQDPLLESAIKRNLYERGKPDPY